MKTSDWYAGRCDISEYEGFFTEKAPYPQRGDFDRYRVVYPDGEIVEGKTKEDLERLGHLGGLPTKLNQAIVVAIGEVEGIIIQWSTGEEEYVKATYAYNEQHSLLRKQFRKDLKAHYLFDALEEYDDIIYSKAWEDGHAGGFGDVACHYEEMVNFVEEIVKIANKSIDN